MATVGTAYLAVDERAATYDAVNVELYREAGGIPLARGNVPQSALSIHTYNYIFGESQNPYDRTRSCGGSTGGDAGLISARCVPLALGTDIGGSCRYPAGFTGVYGFKSSLGRVSYKGIQTVRKRGYNAFNHLVATCGPMGSSSTDLQIGMQVLCSDKLHLKDPNAVPMGWHMAAAEAALAKPQNVKIGMLADSPNLPVSPAVKRALKMARDALTAAGFNVVDVTLPKMYWDRAKTYFMAMIRNGNSLHMLHDFEGIGEAMVPALRKTAMLMNVPWLVRLLWDFWNVNIANKRRFHEFMDSARPLDYYQLEEVLRLRQVLLDDVRNWWQKQGLTACIAPMWPHVSP